MFVDFHTHTTGSDGTFDPIELVEKATNDGIEILSITDHDTIDGVKSLETESNNLRSSPNLEESELLFLPGVEISAEFPETLHILGYGIEPDNAALCSALEELQSFRLNRNRLMVEMMNAKGFEISIDELLVLSGGDLIGRPHFAKLMVNKGYVSSRQEAFDRYLAKGAEFYLDKKRLSPRNSIELITNAGGVPVMAHPYQTGRSGSELERLIIELREFGLQGIEVFYSKHTPAMIMEYFHYAQKYELLSTAGSDFHGTNKPEVLLGMNVSFANIRDFLCLISDRLSPVKSNRR